MLQHHVHATAKPQSTRNGRRPGHLVSGCHNDAASLCDMPSPCYNMSHTTNTRTQPCKQCPVVPIRPVPTDMPHGHIWPVLQRQPMHASVRKLARLQRLPPHCDSKRHRSPTVSILVPSPLMTPAQVCMQVCAECLCHVQETFSRCMRHWMHRHLHKQARPP